ncbi:MAG TPA: alpha/beta hydrolase-fold protein [Gammaproteobacteria bacterium]|jgi:S-formylglutathione hydrolase FrmB|nr:alpha/beta hydrolase-fold protein [Gammaproteobacteria bacterium]
MLNRFRRSRLRDIASSFLVSCLLFGCASLRKPSGPIPVKEIPAPQRIADRPLVIVLPGRGDDLDDLQQAGIAEAVQRAWPQADVLLAGATLAYYLQGNVAVRLHDEVVAPARQRGYREIWLAGASMGGMGALLYERTYPHDVTGLVLMAPFMGNPSLIKEVAAAGGPAAWDPGLLPTAVNSDNYQREIWRVVKSWSAVPAEGDRVWLICGDKDRFMEAARLMAPQLPAGHFIEGEGGHDWPVWDTGAGQVFARIAARQ